VALTISMRATNVEDDNLLALKDSTEILDRSSIRIF